MQEDEEVQNMDNRTRLKEEIERRFRYRRIALRHSENDLRRKIEMKKENERPRQEITQRQENEQIRKAMHAQMEVRDPRRFKTWNETRRQLMAMIEIRRENQGREKYEIKENSQENDLIRRKDDFDASGHQHETIERRKNQGGEKFENKQISQEKDLKVRRKDEKTYDANCPRQRVIERRENEKKEISQEKDLKVRRQDEKLYHGCALREREIKEETINEKLRKMKKQRMKTESKREESEKDKKETKHENERKETKHEKYKKETKHEKNQLKETEQEKDKLEEKHREEKKFVTDQKRTQETEKHETTEEMDKKEIRKERIKKIKRQEKDETKKQKERKETKLEKDKKNKWEKLNDAKHRKRKQKPTKKAKKFLKDRVKDKEQGVRKVKKKFKWNTRIVKIMDVDLLRPGTVPISPDTSLWFEFLLDPNLLEKHLKNPFADPTPSDMIIKFLTLSMTAKPADDAQTTKPSKKAFALKILAIKVAAFLKWDLKLFENKLHLSLQAALLRDFLNIVSDKYGDITTHTNIDFSQLESQEVFVVYLYHRWVLRTFRNSYLSGKIKTASGLVQSEVCDHIEEFCFHKAVNEINAERSYIVLKNLSGANLKCKLIIPTISTFTPLTESVDEAIHKWNVGKEISIDQFQCQLFMDLTNYLMHRENYSEAKKALQLCCVSFDKWKKETFDEPFSTVTSETISSRCLALGISTNQSPSLVEQFHKLVSEHYMGIEKVFEKDNLTKEIPKLYRDCLELDITSEINTGKITVYRDTLSQIQASNQVRRALEGGSWQTPKVTPSALQNALIPVIAHGTETELNRLKYLVGNTLVNGDFSSRELAMLPTTKQLLTEEEINSCVESDYMDIVPEVLSMDLDKSLNAAKRFKSPSVQMAALERLLISSYDSADIEKALSMIEKLKGKTNMPNNSVLQLNRNWDLPGSVAATIQTLTSTDLQELIFIILAKAYELDTIKNYSQAKAMMRAAIEPLSSHYFITKEEPNVVAKLTQLIKWEILLIEIHEFHSEWPGKRLDWSGLGQKCIQVLNKVEGLLPRVALKEECALTLLNTGQWASLTSSPQLKHSSVALADLYASIASACEDMNKFNVKISTDVWDKVLSMLATYGQKRQGPAPIMKAFSAIVDLNGLVVVISILAKIHNILIEQPQLELQVQLSQVWPTTIKNTNQLNLKYVSEVLMDVLDYALKLAPNNLSWLKLKGDLHFANGNYSSALRSYLEAAIAGSDYFSRPLIKSPSEDYVYKRMIKSCTALQCFTQAGILCQFLDEVDYTTAFKSLSEGCCNDAMDSYYDCIWDVNILEFLIYLHTKRGEHHRKQKVIRTMGLLELNSNNNDEIKREAENLRKGRFLRAMAAQYLS